MIEIKFQGRGGQGVVVASEILARSSFEEGKYAQSYSVYGGERRGALVAAYVRVSDQEIRLKCDIERADHLVLFDGVPNGDWSLSEVVRPGGVLLINAEEHTSFEAPTDCTVGAIQALRISRSHGLGAIVNTAVLGAYVGLTQIVGIDSLLTMIRKEVPAAVEENLDAAKEAYEEVFVL